MTEKPFNPPCNISSGAVTPSGMRSTAEVAAEMQQQHAQRRLAERVLAVIEARKAREGEPDGAPEGFWNGVNTQA